MSTSGSVNEAANASVRARALQMLQVRNAAKSSMGSRIATGAGMDLMLALYCVDTASEGQRIGTLAKRAYLPRTTTIRWLTELRRIGFVELAPDRRDRRATRANLTHDGRAAIEQLFVTCSSPATTCATV